LECDMILDLSVIHRWLIRNGLRPNLSKTQFMIFSKPGQIITTEESLLFNDIPIQRVSKAKYLGVILDQNLDWKPQVESVIKKLLPAISAIYRLKSVLNQAQLLKIYHSAVHVHLTYASCVWGGV